MEPYSLASGRFSAEPYQSSPDSSPKKNQNAPQEIVFHRELAYKLWAEVALPKRLTAIEDHREHVVEVPPAETEEFLEGLFYDWMAAFTERAVREDLRSRSPFERQALKKLHEQEILRSFNQSVRSEMHDDRWQELSVDEQTSLAVRAFRALISNQPEWVGHVNNLIIDRHLSVSAFFASPEGEQVLTTINRSFGLTRFPSGFIQSALGRLHLVVKNGVIEVAKNAVDREAMFDSEEAVAFAEGTEVRQLHETAFARASDHLKILQQVEQRLRATLEQSADLPDILSWRSAVQHSALRILEIRERIKHIEQAQHVHEKDQRDAKASLEALYTEKQQREIQMETLRNIGQAIESVLRLDPGIIPPHASLYQALQGMSRAVTQFSRDPFAHSGMHSYGD